MRHRLPLTCCLFLIAASLFTKQANSIQDEHILARCGSSGVDATLLLRRFARLSGFQRRQFGNTAAGQLRAYVEQSTAKDLLLLEQAKRLDLVRRPRIRGQYQLLLRDALIGALTEHIEHDFPVTDAEVKAYYDGHPELFKTKERVRISRLLVESADEAAALIERVRRLPNMDDWRNLVREKSKDKATSERGGDLGFVAADGSTDVPELEVDPALFLAARDVGDGEIVKQPVPEGKRFAVVWRRGSVAARSVELVTESTRIRRLLTNERVDRDLDNLIERLRAEHLREHHPERLNGREFPMRASTTLPAGGEPALTPHASATQEH
ncbi:MAG TPA: peptidyl-prolyl cis-trans isomerase [Polyangiaceae bacterium]